MAFTTSNPSTTCPNTTAAARQGKGGGGGRRRNSSRMSAQVQTHRLEALHHLPKHHCSD
jgi:hypothetical protein